MSELFPVTNKPDEFELFWSQYPRKVGKLAAQRALKKALKRSTISEIMKGLAISKTAWVQLQTKTEYIPYPATWLNAGRWMDYQEDQSCSRVADKEMFEAAWRYRLKGYKPGGFWSSHWGSRPEHGGTDIPRHILAEWANGHQA